MARQDKIDLRAAIAVNIKLKMHQQGIETLADLAKLAVISRSMMSTIVNCKTSPRVDTIQRIAEALSCPAAELFYEDSADIPVMKDEEFLALYARFQLASKQDRDLVKRILFGDVVK